MTDDQGRAVEASTGEAKAATTDPSEPPIPVPDGFPKARPHHDQARPALETGDDDTPLDPGPPTMTEDARRDQRADEEQERESGAD